MKVLIDRLMNEPAFFLGLLGVIALAVNEAWVDKPSWFPIVSAVFVAVGTFLTRQSVTPVRKLEAGLEEGFTEPGRHEAV